LKYIPVRSLIFASLSYFGLVFAVGFLLGVVRVLWLAPAVGERYAELLEMPVMLAVAFFSAGFILDHFELPGVSDALVVGIIALLILLALEFTLVLGLRGLSLREYLANRDRVSGSAYVASLVVFAVLPGILKRVRNREAP